MADDLVAREWNDDLDELWAIREHNALARAHLAVVADAENERAESAMQYLALEGQARELSAQLDHLRWSLLIAEAERDNALWTLERVNGRAQVPEDAWPDYRLKDALRDIRAMCLGALNRG